MEKDPAKVSWRNLSWRVIALAFACAVIGGALTGAALTAAGVVEQGNVPQVNGWGGVVVRVKTGLFLTGIVVAGVGAVVAYFMSRLKGFSDYSAKELAVTSQVLGFGSICCCGGFLCLPTIVLSIWALVKMVRNEEDASQRDVTGALLMGLMSLVECIFIFKVAPFYHFS